MDLLFNQYSYLTFSAIAVLLVAFVVWRLRLRRLVQVLTLIVIVGVATGGWLLLHPGVQDADTLSVAEQAINSGRPTLVEFYSNYCVGCMAVRAQVDDLVDASTERFGDDLNILRIDIHTDLGRALRERYGFSYSPEFVLFDQAGSEIWRSHQPPSLNELEQVVVVRSEGEVIG